LTRFSAQGTVARVRSCRPAKAGVRTNKIRAVFRARANRARLQQATHMATKKKNVKAAAAAKSGKTSVKKTGVRAPEKTPAKSAKNRPPAAPAKAKQTSSGAAKSRLPSGEIKKFTERLIRLRGELTGHIGNLIKDNLSLASDDTQMDFRSEEQGTDNFERDLALIRAGSEQEVVFEINEAMNRIRTGAFGLCEDCGKAIEKPRLNAIPYSRRCFKCQSEAERMHSGRRFGNASPVFSAADRQELSEEEESEE